jgi:hypothetical protein
MHRFAVDPEFRYGNLYGQTPFRELPTTRTRLFDITQLEILSRHDGSGIQRSGIIPAYLGRWLWNWDGRDGHAKQSFAEGVPEPEFGNQR